MEMPLWYKSLLQQFTIVVKSSASDSFVHGAGGGTDTLLLIRFAHKNAGRPQGYFHFYLPTVVKIRSDLAISHSLDKAPVMTNFTYEQSELVKWKYSCGASPYEQYEGTVLLQYYTRFTRLCWRRDLNPHTLSGN